MGLFFGTDGLRGEVDKFLNAKLAFRCGNALSQVFELNKTEKNKRKKCKILIGTDTRGSADMLASAFASGAMSGGASVSFVGVCPTAGIGFLTEYMHYDFGVVISASHNPAKYNGIKIFDKSGKKIDEKIVNQIEKNLLKLKIKKSNNFGRFSCCEKLKANYESFLIKLAEVEFENKDLLKGFKIVLDCSNGASYKIAPKVFKFFGAEVIETFTKPNGKNINKNCGSLNIETLKENVLKERANVGFAFDGDSDRVIAVAESGEIVDGDQIVYILANYYKEKNRLKNGGIVCTKHTNFGIELSIRQKGISMYRTEIGDKFVSDEMDKNRLVVGGEKSGHIFVKDKLKTGDGILVALMISSIMANKKQKLSALLCRKLIPQINKNIEVKNKEKILENKNLMSEFEKIKEKFEGGRLFLRVSGTESVIRIMAENKDEEYLNFVVDSLEKIIKEIDSRGVLCAE